MLIVAVNLKVLFKSLISMLGLAIAFRVIAGGEVELHVKCFNKCLEEGGHKLRVLIGCDVWETLCFEKTWVTKSLANLVEVIVSCVRMKMLCFDNQSMMIRMVLKLEDGGSFSMKSMEMEFQGHSRIGSCLRSL